MDVGETFQDDFKTPSSSQTLFPLSSTSIKELEKHALFPVGSEPTALPNEDTGGGGLDWLSNPSYGDAAVASVVELQEAIAEHHAASVQSENRFSNAARETSEGGSDDQESQGTADPGDEGPAPHSRQKAKHKHKHKKNKVKKKELAASSRVGSQLSEKVTVSTKKVFIEEMSGLEPEDAFRIDRKRDKDLWTYECLFKAHIAGYRRLGHSALGLQGNLDLFKHEKNSSKKAEAVRYCQKRSRALLRKVGEKVRHVDREAGQVQYIPLGGVTDTATDPLRVLDEATRQYVQGRGTEEAGETEETQLDDEILQQVARYNKNLRENTSNVKLWLEFVKFQDQVFRGDSWRRGGLSQAVIDKKLAILERALSDNPGCLDLKLAQLEVCEDVWGTERLAQEWDQLLFVHSANTKLWHSYLLYQQSRLTSFSVPKLIKLYHKCFRVLTAVVEGNMQTARPTDVPDSALMDVFVQYCMFLHQVGHTERAVASYQAIIEFNLFCPPNLTDTMTGDRAAVFESFWDSSVARFGEAGAAGWGAWRSRDKMVAETGGVTPDTTEEAEEAIISKQMPTWKTWLEIETLRENSHWLPWRPDLSKNETEEDCEDLERLVLVDDITPVLFRVAEPDAQFRLVLCLLRQLGVATWDVLSQLCLQQQEGTSASSMQLSLHKMCQLPWLPAARSPDLDGADDQSETLQRFIHQTLTQAVRVFRGQSQTVFTLLLIQTEWRKHGVDSPRDLPKHKSKVLRKFVKKLLKEGHNRNNLTVWNAYACLEHELGRSQDAFGVVETALVMFSGDSSEDKSGLCLLYQTYCQLLLHVTQHLHADLTQKQIDVSQQQKTRLMFCLTSLAEGTKFQLLKEPPLTTSTMLRTRRKLKTRVTDLARTLCKAESAHGEGNTRVFHHLLSQLNCLAMFELCSSGLEAAMSNYQDVLLLLDGSKSSAPSQPLVAVRENIYRSQWILLRHQMSVGAVPLSQLRVVIDRALQEFPDSSAFLQCLVDLEARSHIVGRLRRYMDRALVNPASPVPLLHTVLVEVVRLTSLQQVAQTDSYSTTGVMHRVRSVLERGTQSSASQHCPLVWRLYSHVESKFGDRERAKGIFYRALQQCPWSKVLYKDGVRLFGQSQLQEMVDLMTEKELRVQIPVEELDLLCQSDPVPHSPQEEEMVEV